MTEPTPNALPEQSLSDDDSTEQRRRGTGRVISTISLIVAVIALIIVLLLRACGSGAATTAPTDCTPGMSAYEVWLSVGNEGSVEDFLKSIVGEKGADGYVGSDGFSGEDGISAYQQWLDAGNKGSEQDFLDSLIGSTGLSGAAGAAGISAYQLWLNQGHTGSEADFLDWLVGPAGTPGTDGQDGASGATGQSAYELWLQQPGNAGMTETEFLASLIGLQGPAGVCTVGDTGATGATGATGPAGADGLSSFEIWLQSNPNGTIESFWAFLTGPTGATGATGATGPAGPQGIQGIQGPIGPAGPQGEPGTVSGFGYSGSWYDTTNQAFGSPASGYQTMRFNTTQYENGVSIDPLDTSKIVFAAPGTYNVQFSAQLSYPVGGTDKLVNIWLAQNGSTLPDTNTRMLVPGGNDGYVVAAWNFFVTTTTANDYVQLVWNANDPTVQILHETEPTGTGIYQPGIPSIILTVNQVAGIIPPV